MRKNIVAGNWKMNIDLETGFNFLMKFNNFSRKKLMEIRKLLFVRPIFI